MEAAAYPAAQAAAGLTPVQVGPAVLVVLAVIGIWKMSTAGRGEVKLRLLAWVLLPVIVWTLLAARSPAEGARIASGAASGISVALGALSRVVSGI